MAFLESLIILLVGIMYFGRVTGLEKELKLDKQRKLKNISVCVCFKAFIKKIIRLPQNDAIYGNNIIFK